MKAKLEKRSNEVYEESKKVDEKLNGPLGVLLHGQANTAMQAGDKEKAALRVAIRQKEEQIKDLIEERDRQSGKDVGFWRGFGRTLSDSRTWDFGIGDVSDALTMLHADKYQSPGATEGERRAGKAMMKAIYDRQQTESQYGENASFWNRAGVMTGHMPSFMLDFALTGGGYGAINGAGKTATRVATKLIGKDIVKEIAESGVKAYAKKYGVRGVARMAENWTIKALGTTADELLIRAPLMTNTVQAGKTAADVIDRKLGDVQVDSNGNYNFANDKTWGSAVWQGEANAIIENYSEMFGKHLEALAKTFGGKRISGILARANASSYGQILATTRKQFERLGVSDYFGEVGEEYYGQLWRTMLNLDDAYTNVPVYDEQGNQVLDAQGNPVYERKNLLFTGKFHGDIWGGMALSMGLMGAGKYTISGVAYGNMKHRVNVADRVAAEVFTPERWEPIRRMIDSVHNENMGDLAETMVNDPKLSDKERAAVMEYMERSLNLRGLNLGAIAQSRGEGGEAAASDEKRIDAELSEAYMKGYDESDQKAIADAQKTFDLRLQRVESLLGPDWVEALDNNPVAILAAMSSAPDVYTQEHIDTALDYVNAKTFRDGFMQRVSDDVDEQIAQSDAIIDARINTQTGMIHPATMDLDNRQVFIVSGSLAINDDGSIDREASDESIVVRDAVTGEVEFADPKSIVSAGEAIDPEMEKAIAVDNIRQRAVQAEADALNGVLPLNPGDVVPIMAGGSPTTLTIVGPAMDEQTQSPIPDMFVVELSNGLRTPLTREWIQAYADEEAIAKLNNFEQQRRAERAQQQATEAEALRPQFALNDEFTILNDNGTPIRGSITAGLDEDGTVEIHTEEPINGNYVNRFTPAELEEMFDTYNGQPVATPEPAVEPGAETGNIGAENIPAPEQPNEIAPSGAPLNEAAPAEVTALSQIPVGADGKPQFEAVEPQLAADGLLEAAGGDAASAAKVAAAMTEKAKADVEKLRKRQPKRVEPELSGDDPLAMLEQLEQAKKANGAKEQKWMDDMAAARERAMKWEQIRQVFNGRRAKSELEARRAAEERAQAEEAERAARAEAEQRKAAEDAERRERELAAIEDQRRWEESPEGRAIIAAREQAAEAADRVIEDVTDAEVQAAVLREDKYQGGKNYVKAYERWGAPASLDEWVARVLSVPGRVKVRWSGKDGLENALFGRATKGERAEGTWNWLTSDANGVGFDEWTHHIWEGLLADTDNVDFNASEISDHEVRNAIIEQLLQKPTSRSLFEYAIELHGGVAVGMTERRAEAEYDRPAIEADWYERRYGMSREDFEAREEEVYREIREELNDDAAFESILEQQIEDYEQRRFEEENAGGTAVLPGAETDNTRGGAGAAGAGPGTTGGARTDDGRAAPQAPGSEIASEGRQPEPTEGQKAAGNYKMEHRNVDGYKVSIENAKGSVRRGKDADGTEWETTMQNDYGYIRGTQGVDGDHIDVFLSDTPEQGDVFVIDQVDKDGNFDEHKVMYGFPSEKAAREAYLSNYEPGWTGLGAITHVSKEEFKKWIGSSKRKTKPFAEYASVKPIDDEVNMPTTLKWSNERADNGEPFLVGANGSIDLVEIKQDVFNKMRIAKAPFRLSPSMVTHVYINHKKELELKSPEYAVEAILDVMNNFDRVRKGRDNSFIFSIEGTRTKSARRAVTLVHEYDKGKWLGIKTVGYDRIPNLKELTTLWEKGEEYSSATGVAPANVPSEQPSQGN